MESDPHCPSKASLKYAVLPLFQTTKLVDVRAWDDGKMKAAVDRSHNMEGRQFHCWLRHAVESTPPKMGDGWGAQGCLCIDCRLVQVFATWRNCQHLRGKRV